MRTERNLENVPIEGSRVSLQQTHSAAMGLQVEGEEDEQRRIPGFCSEFRVWDSFVWVFWRVGWARVLTQWRRGSEGQRDPYARSKCWEELGYCADRFEMRKMSITPIDDAGVLRSLILIILPILGFWMLGIVFGGGMGVKNWRRDRERERKRERG